MIVYGEPSGGRLDIAAAELEALLEASGQSAKVIPTDGLVTCKIASLDGSIVGRAAYLKDVGELLWTGGREDPTTIASDLEVSALAGKRFKVDAEGFGTAKKRSVDELFGEKVLCSAEGSAVSMRGSELVLRVIRSGNATFVGLTAKRREGKWVARRPRARAFFHPSALYPKLARLMVNLTSVPPGGTFLDPFSGTCSTVIEASLVGAYSIGLDIDKKMVFGGRRNLRAFGLDLVSQVIHGDVRNLPLREVDAVAGDVPYGRASSTKGSDSGELISAAFSQGGRCLKRKGRLVIMHQKAAPLTVTKGFEPLGRYELYVHRNLTRVISVFRRR